MRKISKQNADWITPDGFLDLLKFPIEPCLRQGLDANHDLFRAGVMVLGSMAVRGRVEAGVYLLGLMRHYADNLERLKTVVEALGSFQCRQAALALVSEFYRIESSNQTRSYLNEVFNALGRFPRELTEESFLKLAEDKRFSYRMRKKFEAMTLSFPIGAIMDGISETTHKPA